MATEAASAEKQARAQAVLNQHVERIAKSIGVAAPPPARSDNRAAQNASEIERLSAFLGLVADHVDPNKVAKLQLPADLSGFGEYSELDEEQRRAAEARRDEDLRTGGVTEESRRERSTPVNQPAQAKREGEPKPLPGQPQAPNQPPQDQAPEPPQTAGRSARK